MDVARSYVDEQLEKMEYKIIQMYKDGDYIGERKIMKCDGYRKIAITIDNDLFTDLRKAYKRMNMLDLLLDEQSLEKV